MREPRPTPVWLLVVGYAVLALMVGVAVVSWIGGSPPWEDVPKENLITRAVAVVLVLAVNFALERRRQAR